MHHHLLQTGSLEAQCVPLSPHTLGVVDMHKYVQTRTEKLRLKAAQEGSSERELQWLVLGDYS